MHAFDVQLTLYIAPRERSRNKYGMRLVINPRIIHNGLVRDPQQGAGTDTIYTWCR